MTVTENLNLNHVGKEEAILFLKQWFPGNFPGLKITPITGLKIKSIVSSLK
jgi:hypothetical protein